MKVYDYMKLAIDVAKKSDKDIPIGAVIEKEGEILACFHNKKEELNNPTCHSEILCINEASKKLNSWRLSGCNLYVTLEPCPMCAWAILNSRMEKVYFGAYDSIYGAMGGKINLQTLWNFKTEIYGGIMEEECKKLLDDYFSSIRSN